MLGVVLPVKLSVGPVSLNNTNKDGMYNVQKFRVGCEELVWSRSHQKHTHSKQTLFRIGKRDDFYFGMEYLFIFIVFQTLFSSVIYLFQ